MKTSKIFVAAMAMAVAMPAIVVPAQADETTDVTKFKDVSELSASEQVKINVLVDRGVISGFNDGTFRPTAPVTRGQFAAFISRAYGLKAPEEPKSFKDVTKNVTTYDGIIIAYHYNVVAGYPDGRFKPENFIARADMAIMLDNMLQQRGNFNKLKPVDYADRGSIGQKSSVAVQRLNNFGIMAPRANNAFKPNEQGSRLETVLAIYNMLEVTGELKKDEVVKPTPPVKPEPPTKPTPPTSNKSLDQLFKEGKTFEYKGLKFERAPMNQIAYVTEDKNLYLETPEVMEWIKEDMQGITNQGRGYGFSVTSQPDKISLAIRLILHNDENLTKNQIITAIDTVLSTNKKVIVNGYEFSKENSSKTHLYVKYAK
ncbi:S-layer homology domain-containing protein [Sporosarcina jeotgali]|uniref:S-layer homology domain-containing protein n=1 Tax=Sporosarcina jeotgali TaxID=3020056 RepID=A0ABZ0KX95_9BACL|nr:S-layer homology domain-containing protein [Sporosarcina sp. B2O-1]WOV85015.1 S-layer homology domain-containing protein [Sporosarcina sp. B2O-1]